MAKIMAFRGMIYSKFRNETDMARAIGWTKQRLNKITNGERVPTLSEVQTFADALDRSFMEVANIFLRNESPNGN